MWLKESVSVYLCVGDGVGCVRGGCLLLPVFYYVKHFVFDLLCDINEKCVIQMKSD